MNATEMDRMIQAMKNIEPPPSEHTSDSFNGAVYEQRGDIPDEQREILDSLFGHSYAPSQESIDWSKGGSPDPDVAEAKMNARERIEAMLALMRRNSEQTANLHNQDILPPHMMEQRNIDPRDYGAALPPNAPQVDRSPAQRLRPHPTQMRWLDQLLDHIRRSTKNLESGAPTAPPQLTGRSRNRMAF